MLLAEASACTRCDLSLTRQRVVIGSGPTDARVVVVGEAPGRTEDEGGEPFIGRSGQLLLRLIHEELSLERSALYITNVVKCRPPQNKTPKKSQLAACQPWWEEQFASLAAPLVLAVGVTSSSTLLGEKVQMSEVHGVARSWRGRTLIPTYHPAAALRGGPAMAEVLRSDIRAAVSYL